MSAARLIGWFDEATARPAPRRHRRNRMPRAISSRTLLHLPCRSDRRRHRGQHHRRALPLLDDMRIVPDEDPEVWLARYRTAAETVRRAMREVRPGTGIEIAVRSRNPALRPGPDGGAERLARTLTGDNAVHGVSYGTEAGLFQDMGLSTVICGPGSIAQAHQPDEFISRRAVRPGHGDAPQVIRHLAA